MTIFPPNFGTHVMLHTCNTSLLEKEVIKRYDTGVNHNTYCHEMPFSIYSVKHADAVGMGGGINAALHGVGERFPV